MRGVRAGFSWFQNEPPWEEICACALMIVCLLAQVWVVRLIFTQ